ncbi:MAG: hypothetical protein ACSHX6_08830 [Akkermansiaceae bacterium]
MGTHVWLEIIRGSGERTTFSGAKNGKILHVVRNYKRDYDRGHDHGLLEISAPDGMNDEEWGEAVMAAALVVQAEMHGNFAFNGVWPWGKTRAGVPRSNCCCVASRIIRIAGGVMPLGRIRGVLPGLGRGYRDYL